MAQVLLVEKNESLRMILKLNATKQLGLEVIEKESGVEAASFIQLLPNMDLIICRESLEDYTEMIGVLIEDKLSIPLLWIGSNLPAYKNIKAVSSDITWEKILDEAGKILGINQLGSEEINSEVGFEPVDCRYFLNITSTSLGCDVYIKMKKEGKDHFVKCLHSVDKFTRADIEKYMSSGLTEFHVPKTHFVQFVNFVTNKLVTKLESYRIGGEERIKVTEDAYKISVERIQSLGIDDFTVEIVESSVKSMINSVAENNALGNFLKLMKENPLSYVYANAYLTNLILHKIIVSFDWATPQIKAKLTYVSYFHNVSLKDEKLMKMRSLKQIEEANLTQKEKEMVINHAYQSAKMVDTFPIIPEHVSVFIKEHHGSKTGVGFPDELSPLIAPFSMMFLVVEDFVDEFLNIPGQASRADFDKIFTRLNARYTKLAYAQTLKALKEMIFKKDP